MELNTLLYDRVFDMFNHYNLITKINPNYVLVWNKREKMFMVLNSAKNYQICLKTASILTKFEKILNETKIENSKKLFDFIENSNRKLKQKNISKTADEVSQKTKEILWQAKRSNSISKSEIKKLIEEKNA